MCTISWKSKKHAFGNKFCDSSLFTGYSYVTLVLMMMKQAHIIKYSEGLTKAQLNKLKSYFHECKMPPTNSVRIALGWGRSKGEKRDLQILVSFQPHGNRQLPFPSGKNLFSFQLPIQIKYSNNLIFLHSMSTMRGIHNINSSDNKKNYTFNPSRISQDLVLFLCPTVTKIFHDLPCICCSKITSQ